MHPRQILSDLAASLYEQGMQHVVLCPGSRNAPLIHAFSAVEGMHCYSVVDERSAAYVALGMARELDAPVAVVVTSGTAVLNLAPAVAEAFHQQLPLVVFTADRPLERMSTFNNQIIDQTEAFLDHSKGFCELPVELESGEELDEVLEMAGMMLEAAEEGPAGPVHFNVLLKEPLYTDVPPARRREEVGRTVPDRPEPVPDEEEDGVSLADWPADARIMILAGSGMPDPALASALEGLTLSRSALVVAEHLANLPSSRFIHHPELVLSGPLSEEDWSLLAPDLVISIGGQVVSKSLRLALQGQEELQVWELDRAGLIALWDAERGEGPSGNQSPAGKEALAWSTRWFEAEKDALLRSAKALSMAAYSNLRAMEAIHSSLPPDSTLHLGNSATVRYGLYMPLRPDLRYFANRGTSGIDGCLSAAVGAAMVSEGLHVLVLGDLSFIYDSNGLWNRAFPDNLRVVVLNDGEGGIFRLLDGPAQMPGFEDFQLARHPVSLELLSQAFGLAYRKARSLDEMDARLRNLLDPGAGPAVLEADTTACENSRIFRAYKDKIKQAN